MQTCVYLNANAQPPPEQSSVAVHATDTRPHPQDMAPQPVFNCHGVTQSAAHTWVRPSACTSGRPSVHTSAPPLLPSWLTGSWLAGVLGWLLGQAWPQIQTRKKQEKKEKKEKTCKLQYKNRKKTLRWEEKSAKTGKKLFRGRWLAAWLDGCLAEASRK